MPRVIRQRGNSSDEEEAADKESLHHLLKDIKEAQKLRKRSAGLNIADLSSTSLHATELARPSTEDPFKPKHGGIVNLKKMKHADLKDVDIEQDMRQTFSKESHLRDEDEEMRKYVEEELSKKKVHKMNSPIGPAAGPPKGFKDVLFQLSEHLMCYQSKKNEEMLSNQMLCGIPEVDLGVDSKIRNIEETEAAKLRILKEAVERKKDFMEKLTAKQNLAKDLAKSYVQHNIYKIDETTLIGSESVRAKLKRPRTGPVAVVDEDTPKWIEDGKTVEKPAARSNSIKPACDRHRPPDWPL